MSLRRCDAIFGTLVLPMYDAAAFLSGTLEEVAAWLRARPEPWEVVIVDDGSSDGTRRVVASWLAEHGSEAWRSIRFTENRGKGFAVRTGLDAARGEIAVFIDCDLAYPMSNVAAIVDRLAAGADAAVACRVHPDSTYLIRPGFFSYLFTRHVMGRWFNAICRAITVPRLRDTQAGLKGLRTAAVRPLLPLLRLDGFSFDVELLRALIDRRARIEEVPVAFRYDSEPTTVRFVQDALGMTRDLVRVRYGSLRGRYRPRPAPPHRRLVIHADDFGLAGGVNAAIEQGLVATEITSASILVGAAQSAEALRWAGSHPEYDFGVHLNLTHGSPLLPAREVPSLVDAAGRFRPLGSLLARVLLGRVRLVEIEAEWRAQIRCVREAGVTISHLDSHQHVHLVPPVFRRVALRLGREHGLVVRAMNGPVSDWKACALSIATRIGLGRRPLGVFGARGSGASLRRHPTLRGLRTALENAPPGDTYELVVHPGIVDDELRSSGDAYQAGRERERALLAAEETRSWLHCAGFELSDFRGTRPLDRGGVFATRS